jgi:hypothetical protein
MVGVVFVGFVFFNILIFSTVPSSYLFKSFREFHSKTIIIDEIKQENSLIMAFVNLSESSELRVRQEKFLHFLHSLYRNRMRCIDYILEICIKINRRRERFIEIY